MGALVLTKALRFGLRRAIGAPATSLYPARSPGFGSRASRVSSCVHTTNFAHQDKRRADGLYAFVFCQGGFRQLDMTFEQFLLVAAVIKPLEAPANIEGSVRRGEVVR
jgi:hypothetical protein